MKGIHSFEVKFLFIKYLAIGGLNHLQAIGSESELFKSIVFNCDLKKVKITKGY